MGQRPQTNNARPRPPIAAGARERRPNTSWAAARGPALMAMTENAAEENARVPCAPAAARGRPRAVYADGAC
eukprot:11222271-Lingulodinium_polyedra.AAC.1